MYVQKTIAQLHCITTKGVNLHNNCSEDMKTCRTLNNKSLKITLNRYRTNEQRGGIIWFGTMYLFDIPFCPVPFPDLVVAVHRCFQPERHLMSVLVHWMDETREDITLETNQAVTVIQIDVNSL